jgi:hypothetical protein
VNFLAVFLVLLSYGRYQVDSIDSKDAKGTVLLTPYRIEIKSRDTLTLPVTRVIKHYHRTYYFIEGVENNVPYRGSAIVTNSGGTKLINSRLRSVYSLRLELRSKQSFSVTRLSIYYDH